MLRKIFAAVLIGLLVLPFTAFAEGEPNILFVSAEHGRFFQTGGLAHAVFGLASSLNEEGASKADIAMPFYLNMNTPPELIYLTQHVRVPLDYHGGQPSRGAEFLVAKDKAANGGETLFFRHLPNSGQQNYFDNVNINGKKTYGPEATLGEGFGVWAKAVSEYILTQNYDLVVLNDWHSGLVALYLDIAKSQGRKVPKIVLAIHNLAFQGVYPKTLMDTLGIPERYYSIERGIEYHNQISFLKAAIQAADLVYTVSEGYAKEIKSQLFGAGLDGLMSQLDSENRLFGILNGIEDAKWDPSKPFDDKLTWTFTDSDLTGKTKGKVALQAEFNLPQNSDIPLFILTSRVAEQKGYQYLPKAIEGFLARNNAQFVIIGDGDQTYVNEILALQNKFPEKLRYQYFSNRSERVLKAYADFFINAAWFEPSGLNQFFALKNGTIPILSRVGGLGDSIVDGVTGFLFDIVWKHDKSGYDIDLTAASVLSALERALRIYHNNPTQILQMRSAGMKLDNSWGSRVHRDFAKLFRKHLSINLKGLKCIDLFSKYFSVH